MRRGGRERERGFFYDGMGSTDGIAVGAAALSASIPMPSIDDNACKGSELCNAERSLLMCTSCSYHKRLHMIVGNLVMLDYQDR